MGVSIPLLPLSAPFMNGHVFVSGRISEFAPSFPRMRLPQIVKSQPGNDRAQIDVDILLPN
jgi:hypothetical protein